MSTAYEEALRRLQAGESPADVSVPSYITASDSLNVANGNQTFLEGAADVVESIPKFIGTSLISGANQLYNIPADIGNAFGGDFDTVDTLDVISSLDSDLGQFYSDNREMVDLVGFMASSTVPGMAGVKILKAGQIGLQSMRAGKAGAGTSEAIGLLPSLRAGFKTKALEQAITSSSAASKINKNTTLAVAAGFGQGALEAAAFETAVAVTMFDSPLLENQDLGDFASNIFWSAGIFGLVSGGIDAVKLSTAITKVKDQAAIDARPWTFKEQHHPASKSFEKIMLDFDQIKILNETPVPIGGNSPARFTQLQNAAAAKLEALEQGIRKELGVITGGDQDAANALFNGFKGGNFNDQATTFLGLQEVSKFSASSPIAKGFEKLKKKVLGDPDPESLDALLHSTLKTGYMKTWGEGAGTVFSEVPVTTSIIDTLKKGESIIVNDKRVIAGSKVWNFNTAFNKGKLSGSKKVATYDALKSDPLKAQARYMWADNLAPLKATEKSPFTVNVNDIPLMEKVLEDLTEAELIHVRFKGLAKGENPLENFQQFLGDKKIQLANRMLKKGKLTQDEIAASLNIKSSLLSGESLAAGARYSRKDILALQDHAKNYTDMLVKKGALPEGHAPVNIWDIPQHLKLTYDTKTIKGFEDLNNHVVENMTVIKGQQKLYQQDTGNAAALVLGEDFVKYEDITSGRIYSGARPSGAGPGFVTAALQDYGTLAATMSNVGQITGRVIQKFKDRTNLSLEPHLFKLGAAGNENAAIEWSVINQKLRSMPEEYALSPDGTFFEPIEISRWRKAAKEAVEKGEEAPPVPDLHPSNPRSIKIESQIVRDLAKAHIEVNGNRINGHAAMQTAKGNEYNRSPEAFYPIPVNPKKFPFFATVTDTSVTSGGHTSTIYAHTAEALQEQLDKLKGNPQLKVRTKKEAENYWDSIGQWNYEKTVSSNYIDTALKRNGVSNPTLPTTDASKVIDEFTEWHAARDTGLAREGVRTKYTVQFAELEKLGDEFTDAATSNFSSQSTNKLARETIANPFDDYVKTALAVKKTADYPLWTELNRSVEKAFSTMYSKIGNTFRSAKNADELGEINKTMSQAGYTGAAYDAEMEIFANIRANRDELSNVVQKANSVMATVVLRWDALNAANNAISANVLLGAETKFVMRAIARGDEEAVGALSKLTRIGVPGTEDTIFSARKLIANSVKRFNRQGEDFAFFKDNGFMTRISDQYADTLSSLAYDGAESIASWNSRIDATFKRLKKAGDLGEVATGNKLAEEFNRFVAADVMKQMTDVAVTRNLMTKQEQLSYINTFVNRTQGNYVASQRPMMFHGPIGQAIGLFQTYQFNLMQNLLRHVAEGSKKDSLTLLGLQGTIHGMNGLPAFNAMNGFLIGNASGNKQHTDAYDAVNGILGQNAGNWLMYGMASNMLIVPELKVNLYTRGDINPRHPSIVPLNPLDIPSVQATGKVFKNLFDTAKSIKAGGDISTSLLTGLEHNGLSRPLAGLAITLKGLDNPEQASYSTSKRGNVIAANDFLSLTNIVRIVGGKPMDEAVALDAMYRVKAYALVDTERRAVLGKAIKSTLLAGADPSREQIDNFTSSYAELGGTQKEFSKWMAQLYKDANLSQTNAILRNLESPYNQKMQVLMGGTELRDFANTVPTTNGRATER